MGLELAVTFTYRGRRLDYFDHPYNSTRHNERAVEVAVALDWLPGKGRGLEVGNVLGHYGATGHRVIDLHEQAPGVDNLDVFDITGSYDWIVSISTVEHVRWDTEPRDVTAAAAALDHLAGLLAPGGVMLVTVPGGYHPHLDEHLATLPNGCTYTRKGDGWTRTRRPTFKPYGATTLWAESVWVGEW